MKKIAFVTSNPLSAKVFLAPHMKALSSDYEITLISNFSDTEHSELEHFGVSHFVHLPISRDISLVSDIKVLLQLFKHFLKHRYHTVHSITPKAGLIGMFAAKLSFTPKRYHTFTGQVWVTKKGIFRTLLKCLDSLIAFSATIVLADSTSQAEFLLSENVVKKLPLVLAKGSISGVNVERFLFKPEVRDKIRSSLAIKENELVYLFLGRLCIDKGINELIEAFETLSIQEGAKAHLLLVGPNEQHYDDAYFEQKKDLRIHRVGFTNSPQDYYSAADVFVLPSYREGFGTSILEAAAAGLPAIASNIYGLSDAVDNEFSGLLVPPKNAMLLYNIMDKLNKDIILRQEMGLNAYTRVCISFSQSTVVEAMSVFYSEQDNNDNV